MLKTKKFRVKDIGKVITGRTPPTEIAEYFGNDYPFITPSDMVGNKVIQSPERMLSFRGAKLLSNNILPSRSILVSCIGWQMGKVALTASPSFTNQQINAIIPVEDVDADFVYYHLCTCRKELQNLASVGTRTPILNKSGFENFALDIPSLPIQRKIAAILSAYDDLIENNTRRIAILEEMAQSIYQEWFVRFRYPGHEKDSMVESELGMIPEEWRIKALKDFGNVVTGKTPSKLINEYFDDAYLPFIKTPDLHGNLFCVRTVEHLSLAGMLSQENKTIPPNSICVSCIGTAGIVSITTAYAQTNQQINSIVLKALQYREYLYFALLNLRETISRYGSNGATMTNLNKGKFASLRVIFPGEITLADFHAKTSSIFEKIKILQLTNINLRRTRDLLLPKLISGEIDVEALDIDIPDLIEPNAQRPEPIITRPEPIDATQLALPLS